MTTLFTSDHEWLRIEGDVATIGITDYAQSQLGDVVYVELPEIGRIARDHVVEEEVERRAQVRSDCVVELGKECAVFPQFVDLLDLQPLVQKLAQFGASA